MAHRVEGDLRIVGAGLDREIPAGVGFDQLIAVEAGQIDQSHGPAIGEAVTILAVLDEQPGAEAEGDRQSEAGRPSASPVSGPGIAMSWANGAADCPAAIRAAAVVQSRNILMTSSRLVATRSRAAK